MPLRLALTAASSTASATISTPQTCLACSASEMPIVPRAAVEVEDQLAARQVGELDRRAVELLGLLGVGLEERRRARCGSAGRESPPRRNDCRQHLVAWRRGSSCPGCRSGSRRSLLGGGSSSCSASTKPAVSKPLGLGLAVVVTRRTSVSPVRTALAHDQAQEVRSARRGRTARARCCSHQSRTSRRICVGAFAGEHDVVDVFDHVPMAGRGGSRVRGRRRPRACACQSGTRPCCGNSRSPGRRGLRRRERSARLDRAQSPDQVEVAEALERFAHLALLLGQLRGVAQALPRRRRGAARARARGSGPASSTSITRASAKRFLPPVTSATTRSPGRPPRANTTKPSVRPTPAPPWASESIVDSTRSPLNRRLRSPVTVAEEVFMASIIGSTVTGGRFRPSKLT